MKTRIAGVALAAVMACGWASGAEAALLTHTYDFSFGFDEGPYRTIQGSFTVSVDPFASKDVTTLPDFVSNLSSDYGPAFYAFRPNRLIIGDRPPGFGLGFGRSDFYITINPFAFGDNIKGDFAAYSSPEFPSAIIYSTSSSIELSQVPLPASVSLLGAALLAFGTLGIAYRSIRAA